MDLIYLYLPFAPFMTLQLLRDFVMEFYYQLQGLTLAGTNIFTTPATCEIFHNSLRGLIYLNLLGCQIPEGGLATIRDLKTLDTFVHETTVLPGLSGSYQPSKIEGNRRSLKVCLTYVWDNPQYSDQQLSEMMEDYTISRDDSILNNIKYERYGVQHPFMGPISVASCLKSLVTKLSDEHFHPESLYYLAFFKCLFCRGYHPESRIGLPVGLPRELWNDVEDDQGTRLMVTHCRGKTYACFSQWSTPPSGPKVLEKFTTYDYLVHYKDQFVMDMVGDVIDICENLGDWYGIGFRIPRRPEIVHSPPTEQTCQAEIYQQPHSLFDEVMDSEYLRIPRIITDSSSEDGDTEIEE
jgi:hypothetical protein